MPIASTGATASPRSDEGTQVAEQGRDWLSRTLRELREATGKSGSRAAREAGLSQSRISRIESGVFVPTEAEVNTLADLYHVQPAVRRRLLSTVKALREEVAPARVVLQRGAWKLQRRIANIEENAAEICSFAANIVPGLLQTADYARAVFADGGDISPEDQVKAVAERMARSAVLEVGERRITVIMAEGALRWHAGSPEIMVGQLERLIELARAPRLRVGVIPWTQRVDVFALHGFSMYDRRAVVIGTRAATAFITDPQDVATYSTFFDQLEALASFGADAEPIIAGIAEGYRQLI